MSNLGVIDADPSEPPSHEEVIRLANSLLGEFNIPATIEDIGDICAALFVLLYENLFSDRLGGVIRQPVTREDEIHNCQTVIDVLSSDVVRDSLSHIRGVDIVNGDITAISNLLDIFSYLLEYVANGIESDFGTDNEDAKSYTVTEQGSDVNLRVKEMKSNKQMSPVHSLGKKSISSRLGKETRADCGDCLVKTTGRTSPGMNTNENKSAERYSVLNPFSEDGGNFKVGAEDLQMPPSPIRPDQSQSLLGQKTVDSTELEQEYGKDDSRSFRLSPPLKAAFEEEPGLNKRYEEPNEHPVATDTVIGGAATATTSSTLYPTAQTSLHDLEPEGVMPRSYKNPYLSATTSLPKQPLEEDRKYKVHSTVGATHDPIPKHTTDGKVEAESLSRSYHELRHLVERTAAMTRHALQTSPALGRVQSVFATTDSTDYPRPSIPSDGVRRARELNARGMMRGEPSASPSRSAKRVAFTSHTHGSSNSFRSRQPLEELSDNDAATSVPKGSHSHGGSRQRSPGYDDNIELDYRLRLAGPSSPERASQPRKADSKAEAFAKHLARSRQPELGAAHLNLKTEDRAIKKKQEFLQRLYEEDFGEFSEDVKSLIAKDQRTSKNTEKQMLKSYQESKPLVGARKNKTTSKTVSSKKPKMATRGVGSKVKQQTSPGQSTSTASAPSPLKLESEEDLLPLLLNEFPHLHLSDHTWHEMCRKGLHQIEAITRVYRENQHAKGRAQIQLKEAAQRQELLSNIMRKELEATKRMREMKDQKVQQIQMKNKTQDKRVQSSRARRYYNEYQVRARSKQLKRRTKEEMVFRDLFKDAMKIQKERIRDIRQYSTDQRKCLENRRKNEMESLENFYQDQFQMLGEKLTKEKRENSLRDKAQHEMVEQVKRELRKKIESEINLYQDQMFRDDDDAHFRSIDADRVKRQLHMARYAAHI